MENLFNKIMSCCEGGEIYKHEENICSISFTKGEVKEITGKDVLNINLRINKDGKSGSAIGSSVHDDTLIERAILSCKYSGKDSIIFTNMNPSEVQCYDDKVASLKVDDLKSEGKRILKLFEKISENKIIPDVNITRKIIKVHIINSSGFNSFYDKTEYTIGISTNSLKGFIETSEGFGASNFIQISEDNVRDIVHKHNISQNRVTFDTGKYPVVLSGAAMGALMLRLAGGVNGENIVAGISPIKNKLNEKIASEELTVYDFGTMPFGRDTVPFDDIGCRTQKTTLIENGILKGFLLSKDQEEKLNMKATGNSFKKTILTKEIEDAPAVNPSNFYVAGNNVSDEELLRGIEKGLYVVGLMGTHTGNIPGGEYSLNVSIGYLIEDGKLTGKVVDTMVSGNIYEDFLKIKGIGTKLQPMNIVFFPMGYSPAVRFDDISVVGK